MEGGESLGREKELQESKKTKCHMRLKPVEPKLLFLCDLCGCWESFHLVSLVSYLGTEVMSWWNEYLKSGLGTTWPQE